MPAKFSQPMVDRTLVPYKLNYFIIPEHIYAENFSGRFGCYMEGIFGVKNKNRAGKSDSTESELKTYSLDFGDALTIASLTENEYKNFAPTFSSSVVFNKTCRTLLITHNEIRSEHTAYRVKDGFNCDLHRLNNLVLNTLDREYQSLADWSLTGKTYKDLTKGMKVPKTQYLTITWSGTDTNIHPVWKYKSKFVRVLTSLAASPIQDDNFHNYFTPEKTITF